MLRVVCMRRVFVHFHLALQLLIAIVNAGLHEAWSMAPRVTI
jgi:hypothetical protein